MLRRTLTVTITTLATLAMSWWGLRTIGAPAIAIASLPAMLAGWWWGAWPGATTGLLFYPIGTLSLVFGGANYVSDGRELIPGVLAAAMAGMVVGHSRSRARRQHQDLSESATSSDVLAQALDLAQGWSWTMDRQFRLISFNQPFGEVLGRWHGARPQLGRDVVDLMPAAERSRWRETFQRALSGEAFTTRQSLHRSGRDLILELRMRPLRNGDQIDGVIVFAIDITQAQVMEHHLRRADRMSALGTFAAAMVHEINNPLAYLISNIEYLAELPELRQGEVAEVLADAMDGAERVASIIKDLRSISSTAPSVPRPTDLHQVLHRITDLARAQVRYRAHIELILDPCPRVLADPGALNQAFLNLLMNAAQSIREGHPDQNTITLRTRTQGDHQAVVEITDTGEGIPPEHLGVIFDPFFTTRPSRQAAGLGLSITKTILDEAQGSISVDSTEGVGTTICVTLPAAPAETTTETTTPVSGARILVIDDEPQIRAAIRRMLKNQQVDEVHNAIEGLERMRRGPQYDLVLCDLMMPEMTGMDLYEAVAASLPGAERQIAFMTGGTFTSRTRAFLEEVDNASIEKPFKTEDILACIRQQRRRQPVPDSSEDSSHSTNG